MENLHGFINIIISFNKSGIFYRHQNEIYFNHQNETIIISKVIIR